MTEPAGGLAAALVMSRQLASGFLSPATWPAAAAGAVVLLPPAASGPGGSGKGGRQAVPVPARRSRQTRSSGYPAGPPSVRVAGTAQLG
jgi:hypothetical protein